MRQIFLTALVVTVNLLFPAQATAGELKHRVSIQLGIPAEFVSLQTASVLTFPATLGPLKGVRVSVDFAQVGSLAVENLSPFPVEGWFSVIEELRLERADGVSLWSAPLQIEAFHSLSPFDGLLDYAGQSGELFALGASGSSTALLAPDARWSDATGESRVEFNARLYAVENIPSPLALRSRFGGSTKLGLTITYQY